MGYFGPCACEKNFLCSVENAYHEYLEKAVFISPQFVPLNPGILINNCQVGIYILRTLSADAIKLEWKLAEDSSGWKESMNAVLWVRGHG